MLAAMAGKSMGRSFCGELMRVESASYPIGMARLFLFLSLRRVGPACIRAGRAFFLVTHLGSFFEMVRRQFGPVFVYDERINFGCTHE